jgi:transposase-like protein
MSESLVKIEKITPLKCPKCGKTEVDKHGSTLNCYLCKVSFNIKTGKEKKIDGGYGIRGRDPKYDMGDYLE